MNILSRICQKLREEDLVDHKNNAAGLPFALIKLGLVEKFLVLLDPGDTTDSLKRGVDDSIHRDKEIVFKQQTTKNLV